MKKTILLIAIILISVVSFSQTEKSKPAKDTTYYILGTMPDFTLLYRAITSPGDITPNQLQALAKWIQSLKPLPEPKDADKPKN